MKVMSDSLHEKAAEVSALLKLLSGETRLMVLCQLAEGERSVGELAERLGCRAAAVSQQLSLLRHAGIVSQRREGQTVYYRVERPDIRELMQTLYRLYCEEQMPL